MHRRVVQFVMSLQSTIVWLAVSVVVENSAARRSMSEMVPADARPDRALHPTVRNDWLAHLILASIAEVRDFAT